MRPLHDCMVVRVDPVKEYTRGGIIKVAPEPVRTGTILAIGPGRHFIDRFVPTEAKVGDRIAFFDAVTKTKQGHQLSYKLPEDQVLLRENDALFIIPKGVDIEVTQ